MKAVVMRVKNASVLIEGREPAEPGMHLGRMAAIGFVLFAFLTVLVHAIRYLAGGTRTKARFFVRYETLKELGYRSLVHEFFAKDQTVENSAQL